MIQRPDRPRANHRIEHFYRRLTGRGRQYVDAAKFCDVGAMRGIFNVAMSRQQISQTQRFETAEEFLLAVEQGPLSSASPRGNILRQAAGNA